jgi:hypothetical protein
MAGLLKNWMKKRKLASQIEKIRAKSELLKYKTILEANKLRKSTTAINGARRHIEAAEDLKEMVAGTLDKNMVVQILENPTIQQLLQAAAFKFMGSGKIEKGDDELITIYKQLDPEIKENLKIMAMEYMNKKPIIIKRK